MTFTVKGQLIARTAVRHTERQRAAGTHLELQQRTVSPIFKGEGMSIAQNRNIFSDINLLGPACKVISDRNDILFSASSVSALIWSIALINAP